MDPDRERLTMSLRRYRQIAILTVAGVCFLTVAGAVVRLPAPDQVTVLVPDARSPDGLNHQLEDVLSNWRDTFKPEKTAKVSDGEKTAKVSEGEKTAATPATKKPTAKKAAAAQAETTSA